MTAFVFALIVLAIIFRKKIASFISSVKEGAISKMKTRKVKPAKVKPMKKKKGHFNLNDLIEVLVFVFAIVVVLVIIIGFAKGFGYKQTLTAVIAVICGIVVGYLAGRRDFYITTKSTEDDYYDDDDDEDGDDDGVWYDYDLSHRAATSFNMDYDGSEEIPAVDPVEVEVVDESSSGRRRRGFFYEEGEN